MSLVLCFSAIADAYPVCKLERHYRSMRKPPEMYRKRQDNLPVPCLHSPYSDFSALQSPDTSTAGKEWAPDFTTPLLGAKVDEGAAIELDTHITGVPIPEISWTKDGVPIEASERVTLGYDSDKVRAPAETRVPAGEGVCIYLCFIKYMRT